MEEGKMKGASNPERAFCCGLNGMSEFGYMLDVWLCCMIVCWVNPCKPEAFLPRCVEGVSSTYIKSNKKNPTGNYFYVIEIMEKPNRKLDRKLQKHMRFH